MRAVLLLMSIALAACGAVAPDAVPAAPVVTVVKSLGAKQCEGGGLGVDALAAQLAAAGVRVQRQACGNDGRIRPAVCGAADGRIGFFVIAQSQQAQALSLQFAPLSTLPDAREMACR